MATSGSSATASMSATPSQFASSASVGASYKSLLMVAIGLLALFR